MVELAVALKCVSLAESVAKYTGIIKDKLSLKIDLLAGSHFEAGLRALAQAANSEREQVHLLREARERFNQAVSLEKDFRLAASHLGLALCHLNLGDMANAEQSIKDLSRVSPPDQPFLATMAPVDNITKRIPWYLLPYTILIPVVGPVIATSAAAAHIGAKQYESYKILIAPLLDLQHEAKFLLDQSLKEGFEVVIGFHNRKK